MHQLFAAPFFSLLSRRCTSESTDILQSKTEPDVTSMKLSIPKPTNEMLPAKIPVATAIKPSSAFHTTVKYSSLRPRSTAAGRSELSTMAISTIYASVDATLRRPTVFENRSASEAFKTGLICDYSCYCFRSI